MLNAFLRLFRKSVPLADQLRVLAECGIKLNPEVTVADLLGHRQHRVAKSSSYINLLCTMGSEVSTPDASNAWKYGSDDIWCFDPECIEDHGDYSSIVRRLCVLAQGDLPIVDLKDFVDGEGEETWVAFTLDGRYYQWTMDVQNDWVDPSIFSRLGDLLSLRSVDRRFTYIDVGGQNFLIGYACNEQRRRLQTATGIKVEWLHDAPLF